MKERGQEWMKGKRGCPSREIRSHDVRGVDQDTFADTAPWERVVHQSCFVNRSDYGKQAKAAMHAYAFG